MRRLMLLRHAKAVPQNGMADEDRPLAERGRRDVPEVARLAAARGLAPGLALVSPSRRTRETWELFAAAFARPPTHRFEPRLYAAPAEAVLKLVRETAVAVSSLLLVGHNPGFENLARALIESGDADALFRFGGGMPTASLAVIDLAVDDWSRVRPRTGRLEFFVTPASLGAAK